MTPRNRTSLARSLFLWMTLAAVSGIFLARVDFHGFLSTGDHGILLYGFERILHGERPYKDFLWIYGPLMPYYYALCMKIAGINILSVLAGKMILNLAAAAFIFLAVRAAASSLAASAAAIWFAVFFRDFFYSYNHAGGTLATAVILWNIINYIKDRNIRWLWTASATAAVLAFIKINFGLAALFMVVLTATLADATDGKKLLSGKKNLCLFTALIAPAAILVVYTLFLYDLSWTEFNQCMPYFGSYQPYHAPIHSTVLQHLGRLLERVKTNPRELAFTLTVIISFLRLSVHMARTEMTGVKSRSAALLLGLLGAYYLINFHEYLLSGIWYRGVWAEPVGIALMFIIIATAWTDCHRIIRTALFVGIMILALLSQWDISRSLAVLRTGNHYLPHPRAKVFVQNGPDWIRTVSATAAFLEKTLGPRETFLAVPYDPLYYYLTGRKSPTRLLSFIEMNHIPPAQEESVIRDLEQKNVRYMVLSSRIRSKEQGIGTLGETYCPLLARYISEHFIPVERFGSWERYGGWAWDHGTVILKRKD